MDSYTRFIYNNPRFKTRRQSLRNFSTEVEKMLWKKLQKSQLWVKLRGQYGLGPYILDFYCPEKKLAIELDGSIHKRKKDLDEYRTRTLHIYKMKVIRFWNSEVENDINKVIKKIITTLFNSHS